MELHFIRIDDSDTCMCSGITPKDYDGKVIIPAEHEGMSVIRIRNDAFAKSSISSVHIPATVKFIGAGAFEYCENLREVTFEENSCLREVYCDAFAYCTAGVKIHFPETLEEIDHFAFNGAKVDLEIPSTCVCMEFAFGDFDSRARGRARSYPANVNNNPIIKTDDGSRLQLNCKGTGYIFRGGNNEVPDSYEGLPVVEIAAHAFSNDESAYFYIPASVVKCGTSPFYGCDDLCGVSYGGTMEAWKKMDIYVWEPVGCCDGVIEP